jgi:hypothetical protein
MPSYSAIRVKNTDIEIKNELIDKGDVVDFEDLKEILNIVNSLKYPRLCYFVKAVFTLRIIRCMIFFVLSTEAYYDGWQPYFKVIHPLLYSRAWILGVTAWIWLESWYDISQFFDWGWEF